MRIRTGYSFRAAVGSIDDVMSRIVEIGYKVAPITDRASTFGFVKWRKAAKKAGLRAIYGVEIAVTDSINEKKPSVDFFTFIAIDDIAEINRLVELATNQFRWQPLLTYEQAMAATGVYKVTGHRPVLEQLSPSDSLYIALAPSISRGLYKKAKEAGFQFLACSDNHYPRVEDQNLYEVLVGRGASSQTYPQHILDDEEWNESLNWVPEQDRAAAVDNRSAVWNLCTAELKQGVLLHPEKPQTLRQMCIDGAKVVNCDLSDPIYAARLEKELALIAEKDFEDYFYIIADLMQWAHKQMICGPARGSSCGSLVCYLLQITTIDPIPYGLIFERFIDTTRSDLPDIDLDFSDTKRHLVFEYMINKYGNDRVARLGTVAVYKPRSAISEAGAALEIPKWKTDKILESLVERSSGDSRALQVMEDTFNDTPAGRALIEEFPELKIIQKMEGHPRHSSQHAAGIVLTQEAVTNYVAIDSRTGATQCDKKDAEELNLLKIDALGLTQLSVFEDTLQMAGLPMDYLNTVPLDDAAAFDVINRGAYSGIFQYNGQALQSIANTIKTESLEDIISTTALARPGPMASGGTNDWIKRKRGDQPTSYPHPVFEPYLRTTMGIVAYQEQVMEIGRNIGDLSWEDVTALRKAMSKSLGKEFFDKYGDRWKEGARKKGIQESVLDKIWDDLCLSGDTKILNPFPSKGDYKYITIRDLYNRGGLGPTNGKTSKRRRQSILMWDGESLKPHANWGVTYSGQKVTFKVKTECGNEIKVTGDHRFLQRDGSYARLNDLIVGDSVMSIGGKIPTKRKMKKGTGAGGHNWWHKLKNGEPSFSEGVRYLNAMFKKCQHCLENPYQETHHIDGNHENHSIDNLFPVCRICHKKLHAMMDGGYHKAWEKGYGIFADRIVSIEKFGLEDVYDIHMPDPHNNFLAEGIVVHNCAYGSWAFNRSHSVAYGLVSYWCCYLKAHHPFEFAAATLQHETDPDKQIQLLREMNSEGIDYIPVDKNTSTDRWQAAIIDGRKVLLGPVQNVKGIGPKIVSQIVSARARNEPLPSRAQKLLENPKTDIDSLWPVRDAFRRLLPDPTKLNILSTPMPIIKVQTTGEEYEVMVFGVAKSIKPKDENEPVRVAKRGKKLTGPTAALNLWMQDDTDLIYCQVDRWLFPKIGKEIVERGKPGKALYAVKGSVPKGFRMIRVSNIRYIGDIDDFPEVKEMMK